MKWRGLHRTAQGKIMVDAGERCLHVTEEEYLRLKLSPPLSDLGSVKQQSSASGSGKSNPLGQHGLEKGA